MLSYTIEIGTSRYAECSYFKCVFYKEEFTQDMLKELEVKSES